MCGVPPPLLAPCSENMCGVPPSRYTLFLCRVPPHRPQDLMAQLSPSFFINCQKLNTTKAFKEADYVFFSLVRDGYG